MSLADIGLSYSAILPEIILATTGVTLMLVEAFAPSRNRTRAAIIALMGIALAFAATFPLLSSGSHIDFSGMIITDGFRAFFTMVALIASALSLLISWNFLTEEAIRPDDYFALVLFATTGMGLLIAAHDLVVVFLGIETVTIATYVLAGFRRNDLRSTESALKYFILGSFSSAFLLYGIALVYGATRTTNLVEIQAVISRPLGNPESTLLLAGVAMLLIGFGFKLTAVPFHIWTPDVYEGAPTPVTAFLSVGPKAAGFAASLRVFSIALGSSPATQIAGARLHTDWITAVSAMAILTMTFGNFIAITQSNIKRMLAYSSIAHAGYVLVGLISGYWPAVAFYAIAYAVMNLGAFAVVALISRRGDERVLIDDYSGIGFQQPLLSFALTIFLLSLAGIPGTAGFMGKFWIFKSAWGEGFHALVIVGVINTVVSVYYYFRVIIVMFFREAEDDGIKVPIPASFAIALTVTAVGTLFIGLLPNSVFDLLTAAGTTLAQSP